MINLRNIYRPDSLEEACRLLKTPTSYPLYGGGASLIRTDESEIEATVDLSLVVSGQCTFEGSRLRLGSGSTLENLRTDELIKVDSGLGDGLSTIIKMEVPLTLRNSLTLGDVFMECQTNSLLMIMLAGLQSEIVVYDGSEQIPMRVRDWFSFLPQQRRELIVLEVVCHDYAAWRYAFEKVSRTPADTPIVAAMAFCRAGQTAGAFSVVGGIADHPAHYLDGMQSTVADYKGSATYRTEMAQILSRRAIERVIDLAKR